MTQQHLPLRRVYRLLFSHFGPQHWWPGRTRFEICLGAILTQNAAWTNVQRAIGNLRRAGALSPKTLRFLSQRRLAALIHPSGFFRVKAKRLRSFLDFLFREYRGDLRKCFREPTDKLREKLFAVHGIGPETADSMLLYAGGHRIFVVDAYTRRVMAHHGWIQPDASYEEIQALFHRTFPRGPSRFFNEYHALLVAVGKNFCRRRDPQCDQCPLQPLLPSCGPIPMEKK